MKRVLKFIIKTILVMSS